MRRIIALLSVLSVMAIIAAMMAASAAPVFAQDNGARVTPCSEVFGPEVTGVIVFTRGGSPALFNCQGGPFPPGGGGEVILVQCSEVFGDPEITGVIVVTPGGTPSQFTCQGGPFG
jgi:hypothetical protein